MLYVDGLRKHPVMMMMMMMMHLQQRPCLLLSLSLLWLCAPADTPLRSDVGVAELGSTSSRAEETSAAAIPDQELLQLQQLLLTKLEALPSLRCGDTSGQCREFLLSMDAVYRRQAYDPCKHASLTPTQSRQPVETPRHQLMMCSNIGNRAT